VDMNALNALNALSGRWRVLKNSDAHNSFRLENLMNRSPVTGSLPALGKGNLARTAATGPVRTEAWYFRDRRQNAAGGVCMRVVRACVRARGK